MGIVCRTVGDHVLLLSCWPSISYWSLGILGSHKLQTVPVDFMALWPGDKQHFLAYIILIMLVLPLISNLSTKQLASQMTFRSSCIFAMH